MDSIQFKFWHFINKHPWIILIGMVLIQTIFALNSRSLWYSDEVRYANAFMGVIHGKHWLVLSLNGIPYPDKPPLYFWFLAILSPFFPGTEVFFVGALISGIAVLLITYRYARTLNFSKELSLSACLVLMTSLLFIFLLHYSRMDLLFTFFILLCQLQLFMGLEKSPPNNTHIILAGFWSALAVLTKGPLGILFPLLTLVSFLLWQKNLKRLLKIDFLIAFLIMIIIIGSWLGAAMLTVGTAFIKDIFLKQIVSRAIHTFHHEAPFYYYCWALPIAFLPWSILFITLPFKKLMTPLYWTTQNSNFMWLKCSLLSAFIFLSCLSGKVFVYVLPLLPILSILAADYLFKLPRSRLKKHWLGVAFIFIIFAVGNLIYYHYFNLFFYLSFLAGILLLFFHKKNIQFNLLLVTFAWVLLALDLHLIIEPTLNISMSTENLGKLLYDYQQKGFTPIAYATYPGIFSYYAKHTIIETENPQTFIQQINIHPKTIIVARADHWDEVRNKINNMTPLMKTTVAGLHFILSKRG